jgi:hypothetical protein
MTSDSVLGRSGSVLIRWRPPGTVLEDPVGGCRWRGRPELCET